MKKNFILLIALLFLVLPVMGQIPRMFNYQGIARLADGSPMSNQNLSVKIAILPDLNETEAVFKKNIKSQPIRMVYIPCRLEEDRQLGVA